MDSAHQDLLFHTKVRWLSRGNVLDRVYELREELETFMDYQTGDKAAEFLVTIRDPGFKPRLAFLADFFETLNNLNKTLQGRETTIVQHSDALKAFIDKLGLWERKVERSDISAFHRLTEVLSEEPLSTGLQQEIGELMSAMKKEFQMYFPEFQGDEELQTRLARNPFRCDVDNVPDSMQEEFLDLINNSAAKDEFQILNISDFWSKFLPVYPLVCAFALKVLIPFSSTYLCESAFSSLVNVKSKFRNRLDAEADMRCALSKTVPRITDIVSKKQLHPSH
jgi:hypothetical protein